jgi:hypothetical protein
MRIRAHRLPEERMELFYRRSQGLRMHKMGPFFVSCVHISKGKDDPVLN